MQQVKDHLKIDFDYENELIKSIITASIEVAEDYAGISIFKRNVVVNVPAFPNSLDIPLTPIVDDEFSVMAQTSDGSEFDASDAYMVRNYMGKGFVFEKDEDADLPTLKKSNTAVEFTYVAGFTKENLPPKMVQAILLWIAEMYEYRTNNKEINSTRAMALMRPYKVW